MERKDCKQLFYDLCGERILDDEIDRILKQIFESGKFEFDAQDNDYHSNQIYRKSSIGIKECQPCNVQGEYIPFQQIATKVLVALYGLDENVAKEIAEGKHPNEKERMENIKIMVESVFVVMEDDWIFSGKKPRQKLLEAIMQGPADNSNFLELNVLDRSRIVKCLEVIHKKLGKDNGEEFETIGWDRARQYLFVLESILEKKGIVIEADKIKEEYELICQERIREKLRKSDEQLKRLERIQHELSKQIGNGITFGERPEEEK